MNAARRLDGDISSNRRDWKPYAKDEGFASETIRKGMKVRDVISSLTNLRFGDAK